MRWAAPQYFYYIVFVFVLWLVHFILLKRDQRKAAQVFTEKRWNLLSAGTSKTKGRWKLILRTVGLAFLFLALARPQMGASQLEVKSEGVEIVLMIDVSDSMMAEDLRPSRLEQAKIELTKLVDYLPGHKIGVVAFAGSAVLLSPLSNDPSAIKMYLESLSPLSVSSQGTNFTEGLKEAQAAFERGGVAEDEVSKVTKVVLIASDGEDHEPGAIELAKKMAEKNIRIYSVAYGTEKGAPIPVRDKLGYLREYKKDRNGQTVLSTVKGEALQTLASTGLGKFYFSTFAGDHMKKVAEEIDRLEKTQFDSSLSVQYDEKFQIFIALGLFFLFLDLLLDLKRTGKVMWKGRFEVGA